MSSEKEDESMCGDAVSVGINRFPCSHDSLRFRVFQFGTRKIVLHGHGFIPLAKSSVAKTLFPRDIGQ